MDELTPRQSEFVLDAVVNNDENTIASKIYNWEENDSRRGIRVKFYRNGDLHFPGFEYSFCHHSHKNLDCLQNELNNSVLCKQAVLPYGIRSIFTTSGKKIREISEFKDGDSYIVSSTNYFIKLDYLGIKRTASWKHLPRYLHVPSSTKVSDKSSNVKISNKLSNDRGDAIQKSRILKVTNKSKSLTIASAFEPNKKGKMLYLVRNSVCKPRQVFRWLLNPRTAPNFEVAMNTLSSLLSLETGMLKQLMSGDGCKITCLRDLYEKSSQVIFAFGKEPIRKDDFELISEEMSELIKLLHPAKKISDKNLNPKTSNKINKHKLQPLLPTYFEVASSNLFASNHVVVKRCTDVKKKIDYNLKIIDIRKLSSYQKVKINKEILLMKALKHEVVMETVNDFSNDFFHYLIIERVPESSLTEALLNSEYHCEKFASEVVEKIASGLQFLHSLRVMLRHITMDNVLVEKNSSSLKKLKLCDFGLATRMKDGRKLTTICGSPHYISPEMLLEVGYDSKVDLWSLGIILHILLHGFPPYSTSTNDYNEIFCKITMEAIDLTSSSTWDHVSHEAKDLIKNLLCHDPDLRTAATNVLDHPWIKLRVTCAPDYDLRPVVGLNLQSFVIGQKKDIEEDYNALTSTAVGNESLFFVNEEEEREVISSKKENELFEVSCDSDAI